MKIKFLNRKQYLDSVTKMCHFESLKFAKQSLLWWDKYYSWRHSPCLCLEKNGTDVCYLFYHISKDKKYLTIHNLLTPYNQRSKGYGKKILSLLFSQVIKNSTILRVKMLCVSSSLPFYMRLGIDFWGVNHTGHYYTDFPMPKINIEEIQQLMKEDNLDNLTQQDTEIIYDKLKDNGKGFDTKQTAIFQKSLKLLGKRYRFQELQDKIHI